MIPRRGLPLLLLLVGTSTWAARDQPIYGVMTGGERDYVVRSGDTVWSITGRFTMSGALFDTMNPLVDPDRLQPGMRLRVSDRHIVPTRRPNGIVIDLVSRTLYWFQRGAVKGRFPVAIGRGDWATPPGRYRIVSRREDPEWRVPSSIQKEMRARGEKVVATVPAGPDNPLGKYYIQLSVPGYGLHGTNAPGSIGKYATHGCLRLLPADIECLYRDVPDGTPVDVVYEPVKVARDRSGRVYLEVHKSVYRNSSADDLRRRIESAGLGDAVDWARVTDAEQRAWGAPEDVTLTPTSPIILVPPVAAE